VTCLSPNPEGRVGRVARRAVLVVFLTLSLVPLAWLATQIAAPRDWDAYLRHPEVLAPPAALLLLAWGAWQALHHGRPRGLLAGVAALLVLGPTVLLVAGLMRYGQGWWVEPMRAASLLLGAVAVLAALATVLTAREARRRRVVARPSQQSPR